MNACPFSAHGVASTNEWMSVMLCLSNEIKRFSNLPSLKFDPSFT